MSAGGQDDDDEDVWTGGVVSSGHIHLVTVNRPPIEDMIGELLLSSEDNTS